jgi:hypothetical protein
LIAEEVSIFRYASTDTSATILTYLLFELWRHPHWYACLRTEVLAATARHTASTLSAHSLANVATVTAKGAKDGHDAAASTAAAIAADSASASASASAGSTTALLKQLPLFPCSMRCWC